MKVTNPTFGDEVWSQRITWDGNFGILPANWGMDYATDPTELRGTISTTIDLLEISPGVMGMS